MRVLEERMRALLRWYPRSWREQHGDVMLATLLDDAEARGLDEPAPRDAWSLRIHGVAAHATATTAAVLAAATLVAVLVADAIATIGRFGGPTVPIPPGSDAFVPISIADLATQTLLLAIALPLVAWSLLALVGARRASSATALLLAAVGPPTVGLALAVAAIVTTFYPTVVVYGDGSASISGVAPAWVLVPSALLIAACAVPLVGEMLPDDAAWTRWPLAFVIACIAGALAIAAAKTMVLTLVAVALLLSAFVAMRADVVVPRSNRRWSPQIVGVLGGVALCVGAPTATFSVLAAFDLVPVDADAMRLVTALAAAGSIAVVVAGAHLARAVVGAWAWAPAATLLVAIGVACIGIVLGEPRLAYAAVATASAACAGAALAVTAFLLLPPTAWRAPAALGTGIVATILLAQSFIWLVPMAWIAGAPLVVVAIVRSRRDARADARLRAARAYA